MKKPRRPVTHLEPAPPRPTFEPRTSEPIMPCTSGPVMDDDLSMHKPGPPVDPSKYPQEVLARLGRDLHGEGRNERNAAKRARKARREAKRDARRANRR